MKSLSAIISRVALLSCVRFVSAADDTAPGGHKGDTATFPTGAISSSVPLPPSPSAFLDEALSARELEQLARAATQLRDAVRADRQRKGIPPD